MTTLPVEPEAREEQGYEMVEVRSLLRSLLAHLPRLHRRVVWLRFGSELTHDEIGRNVGLSRAQVGTVLARSLDRLRLLGNGTVTTRHEPRTGTNSQDGFASPEPGISSAAYMGHR